MRSMPNVTFDQIDRTCTGKRSAQKDGFRTQCPAHGGDGTNLSVLRGADDSAILKCHSHHCAYSDIISALHIEPEPAPAPKRTKAAASEQGDVKEWIYRDIGGAPVLKVVRTDTAERKDIRQMRPAGNGWHWGGVSRTVPLLWADEIATREGDLLIVEGEKAAQAVRDLRTPRLVTTWQGGTGNVSKADLSLCEGRTVVLAADADKPGRKAMRKIAADAYAAGASAVRMLLPEGDSGDDLADLIAAGDVTDRETLDAYLDAAADVSAEEAAADRPAGGGGPSGDKRPILSALSGGFTAAFKMFGLELRWNSRTGFIETKVAPDESIPTSVTGEDPGVIQDEEGITPRMWQVRHLGLQIGTDWGALKERHIQAVLAILEEHATKMQGGNRVPYRITKEGLVRWRAHVSISVPHDPLIAWLDDLRAHPKPSDDPAEDLADVLGDGLSAAQHECLRSGLQLFLASMIHRVLAPGVKIDRALALVGPAGCGKTELGGLLTAPWHSATFRLAVEQPDARRNALVEMHSCPVVACADELAGLDWRTVDGAKELLAQNVDTFTKKYESEPTTQARGFAVYATANFSKRLPWDIGLERRLHVARCGTPIHEVLPGKSLPEVLDPDSCHRIMAGALRRVEAGAGGWTLQGDGIGVPAAAARTAAENYVAMLTDGSKKKREEELVMFV